LIPLDATRSAEPIVTRISNGEASPVASIHDSLLTGYTVDGEGRKIVLHTEPHQGGGTVAIDVIFSGVVACHFEGDCLKNIVFDVEEVPASTIIGDGSKFVERERLYGWPRDGDPRRESAEQFFSRMGCRIFELSCSYGMQGWAAAEHMEQVVGEPRLKTSSG